MERADRSAVDATDHGASGGATDGAETGRDRSRKGAGHETTDGAGCATEDRAVDRLSSDVTHTNSCADFVKVAVVERFEGVERECGGHARSSCSGDATAPMSTGEYEA